MSKSTATIIARNIVLDVLEAHARTGDGAAWEELRERDVCRFGNMAFEIVMADLDSLTNA